MIPRVAILGGSSEKTSICNEEPLGRVYEKKITSGPIQMSSMIMTSRGGGVNLASGSYCGFSRVEKGIKNQDGSGMSQEDSSYRVVP